MLIHLDATLAEFLAYEIANTEAVVQALQNLAQSRYQGDHIITADNGVLASVISASFLNKTTRNVFSKVHSEQSQIGNLRNKLSTYIKIRSIKGTINVVQENNIRIIEIPLVRFERNDIIQPTFFIAENLLDCEFYIKITSWFSKKHFSGRLPSKLNAVYCPGGGDTTEKLLSHHSENQRYLTLCLTDSDQKFPESSLGETTKKCRRLKLNELSHHQTLPTRSVENLISKSQIVATLNSEKGRKALLSRVSRLEKLINSDAWKHFHVKEGVFEIQGPHKPGTEYSYWQSVAIEEQSNVGHADGYLFPPISSKLLLWVVEQLETNDPEDFISEPKLFNIWKDLTRLIASWTCASDPIRA